VLAHYVFPSCENRHVDPSRPTKGWRTGWRHALKRAGFHCRFHDLRHTAVTKLAESQASDMRILAFAGHVSKRMLERYSHIRMEARRTALDAIAQMPEPVVFGEVVHQNVHQLRESTLDTSSKPLN
jgi:integrase